jgi:hypothetical protein
VKPPLTVEQILAWADAHHQRSGRWPTVADGTVAEAPAEHWHSLNSALRFGLRGLPGGNSLARLLNQYRRGGRTLTVEQILAWAEAHRERTGRWPTAASGPVTEAPTEHWGSLESALHAGSRGLPGGDSLARLLDRHYHRVRTLTVQQILEWADAHRTRTGRWPMPLSGPVVEAPGVTWTAIQAALCKGYRGLPGGSSLARLLKRHRGHKGRLTLKGILAWADAHQARTGQWPTAQSGPVLDAPGTTWATIHSALRRGSRGLPGGDSLPRLLERRRGRRRWRSERAARPDLWTASEDELVGTLPIQEAAERTGRTRGAVRTRRYTLGVTDKRKK